MNIYIVCPVRNLKIGQRLFLLRYVHEKESQGNKVYWPPRDTNQEDKIGLNICLANKRAIEDADEIHLFWDETSIGSFFDLGMAFYASKKLIIINPSAIKLSDTKSFHNVIHYWANR